MNDPTLIGPCADYEHDLVELHDGALPPERADDVRLHVGQCARCQAWAHAFADVDAQLATALPRPALSPGFEQQLRERLGTVTRTSARGGLRGVIEREHDSLVDALRRGARRRAVLGAVASVTSTVCALLAGASLLQQRGGLLGAVPEGPERWLLLGAVGSVVAIAALAWSAGRQQVTMLRRLR